MRVTSHESRPVRPVAQTGGVTSARGRAAPAARGFTIIEVMIVLGVSGMLFVAAAVLIAGRQNQTAFDQSIRQIQSQIQEAVNNVAVGYYPNNTDFQCVAGAVGQPPIISAGSASQGTNSGCVFLGKAIQFGVAGTNPEEFTVFTIAGLQQGGAGGTESSSLTEAKPMVVAPSSPSHMVYPDASVTDELQNGLKVARVWYNNGASDVDIGAVAFVNSLAQYSGGSIISGSGQVSVIGVDGTTIGAQRPVTVEAMNTDGGNKLASSVLNPSGGVFMCFDGISTKQYGIIKIGGKSRELSVTLRVKSKDGSTTCTDS